MSFEVSDGLTTYRCNGVYDADADALDFVCDDGEGHEIVLALDSKNSGCLRK